MLINKCLNVKGSSIRVAILDELCRIRMNMKSNIGYVPTRSGDLPSEALEKGQPCLQPRPIGVSVVLPCLVSTIREQSLSMSAMRVTISAGTPW